MLRSPKLEHSWSDLKLKADLAMWDARVIVYGTKAATALLKETRKKIREDRKVMPFALFVPTVV